MATKFVTNLDLNQNQLLKTRFEALSTDPSSSLFEGWVYYNTTSDTLRIYANGVWRTFLDGISAAGSASTALTVNESGGLVTLTPNLATSSAAGVMSAADKSKLDDATADATAGKLVIRDGSGNIKVATPTDAAHAATKGYVDSARQGLDVKQSVRAATTGPVNLANQLEAGDPLDTTVTLVAGNRVLVKNQSTASENGIYVVQASGAAVRATDANGTADTGEVSGGTFVFVEEGTLNADSGFVVSSNGPITVGTDAMNWVQFSGAGAITAGDGLTQTGTTINAVGTTDRISVSANAIDIASTYAGQSSIVTLGTITTGTWNGVDIAVADGGTGASTAGDARTNLGAGGTQGSGVSTPALSRKVTKTIGDGAATSFTIQHGFGTREVMIQVYDAATYDTVIADTVRTDTNNVTVAFSSAPSSDAYVVVAIG
jgi:hypothetical protein